MAKKPANRKSTAKRKEPTKTWHICENCLIPLSDELLALARGFNAPAARAPTADDLWSFYRKFGVSLASEWLKFKQGVEYGEYFQNRLLSVKNRFAALEHKACLIINGDIGKDETIHVCGAIRLLVDQHYDLLRKEFPDHERHPERRELPDDLRNFEIEILDEYTSVESQIRDTAKYLRQVAKLVRAQMEKDKIRGHVGRQLESKHHQTPIGRPAEVDPKELVDFVNKYYVPRKYFWKMVQSDWNKDHLPKYDTIDAMQTAHRRAKTARSPSRQNQRK